MSDAEPLLATYNDIRQQILLRASIVDDGALREEVFTRWGIDLLEEKGEVGGGECCACDARRVGKVSGYWLEPEMGRLTVYVSKFAGLATPPRMPPADIGTLLTGALRFVAKCRMGWHRGLEESSEGFAFGEMISSLDFARTSTRVIILTDHMCPKVPDVHPQIDGEDITWSVWGLERFHRLLTSGREREEITIDFKALEGSDGPIPFLKMPHSNEVYDTYLAIIRGDLLARIYREHGARLLEQNVRTFLQARGKVNKGIRETILKQPEMFLAYNNGLCATAARIEIASEEGSVVNIGSITDFQIVNGGQTTASLTSTLLRDHADLSQVLVQLKLSVIKDPEHVGAIVGNISRFANSQNKVNEADLMANEAFHVRLEHLSRTVWAPSKAGANRETKWFYERARGQYSDEKARRRTPAQLRLFEAEYPSAQWFTKTDLAKFMNTWDGLPHLVSRGAQKNFAEFTLRLNARKGFVPDIPYFQELAAKAILFRSTEKIVSGMNFGGYRANIVTYTLGWLSTRVGGGINLHQIWASQGIDQQLTDLIEALCPSIHRLITDSGGLNVTEGCKSDATWVKIRAHDLWLLPHWKRQVEQLRSSAGAADANGSGGQEGQLVEKVVTLGADMWLSLAHWARETRSLESRQQTVASGIARVIKSRKRPSAKQAAEGVKVLEEARHKGFRPSVPEKV